MDFHIGRFIFIFGYLHTRHDGLYILSRFQRSPRGYFNRQKDVIRKDHVQPRMRQA